MAPLPPAMRPADLLAHADSGQPWPDHGAPAFTDVAAAYQTQLALRRLREARGEQACGYKIGFTNRGIWPRYQVFAPIWGPVWRHTLRDAGDGAPTALPLAGLCQPRLEPEAVFGLRNSPAPGVGLDGLFDALDWVAPGFEIVQSHRPGWRFTAAETVADGALHAGLVVGRRVPVRSLAADAAGLQAVLAAATVRLHCDGGLVETGRGANVLGDPLQALLHFVQALRACPGAVDLQPGDVVTTGTWTDAWPLQPGQHWSAEFSAPLSPLALLAT